MRQGPYQVSKHRAQEIVRRGLSPFSLFPVCDVCALDGKPKTMQVGRWMVHAHCRDMKLATLQLPVVDYRTLSNWKSQHPFTLVTRMAARLKQQARTQLMGLRLGEVLDGLSTYQHVIDRAPAEPNNFGASGRAFDTTKIDRLRAWAQQEVLA